MLKKMSFKKDCHNLLKKERIINNNSYGFSQINVLSHFWTMILFLSTEIIYTNDFKILFPIPSLNKTNIFIKLSYSHFCKTDPPTKKKKIKPLK